MSANTVDYKGNISLTANQTRGPSPAVWADCPWNDIADGTNDGVTKFDDFTTLPLAGTQTSQVGYAPDYKVYAGSGTVAPGAVLGSVLPGGFLNIPVPASTNASAFGHAYGGFKLSGSKADSGKLWFECRLALTTTAAATNSLFVGLAEVDIMTFGAAVPITAADAVTNTGSLLGFWKTGANALGQASSGYSDRATAVTNVGANEALFVAGTLTKLGMVYDPAQADPTQMVQFYQDGKLLPTKLSRATLLALTYVPNFRLGFLVASYGQANAATSTVFVDWVRVAQLQPGNYP